MIKTIKTNSYCTFFYALRDVMQIWSDLMRWQDIIYTFQLLKLLFWLFNHNASKLVVITHPPPWLITGKAGSGRPRLSKIHLAGWLSWNGHKWADWAFTFLFLPRFSLHYRIHLALIDLNKKLNYLLYFSLTRINQCFQRTFSWRAEFKKFTYFIFSSYLNY